MPAGVERVSSLLLERLLRPRLLRPRLLRVLIFILARGGVGN